MRYGLLAVFLILTSTTFAVTGDIGIHDPSTVIKDHGKYYVYGTGGRALVSDDGWTWRRGVTPPLVGAAPDVIHLDGRYYMYVARGRGGRALPDKAEIDMIWTKSLDPNSPDYKWHQGGRVASSNGIEDCNAIDPGAFFDPTTGRFWLTYGSYFGYIRLVELNPKTGQDLHPNEKPINIAINGEASDMIYHDGWYYLFDTHGSCCRGANSGYNIRVGRSRRVAGPFIDAEGVPMLEGGGTLLIGSEGRYIGPGHFGLMNFGDGVQKFSMHFEADLDRGGASVLDIRPLLWKNGWPAAGEAFKGGTFEIQSVHTGTSLDMAVEGLPVGGWPKRPRFRRPPPAAAKQARSSGARPDSPRHHHGGFGGFFARGGPPIPDQDAAQVDKNWPAGKVDAGMSNYLCEVQQKWQITPLPDAGGYPGSPYFKITIAGTDRTLTATTDAELAVLPAFTGAPEQLWRIDQLADGTWRIEPKAIPNSHERMALSAVGASFAT
ncbi:MAG: family 43 glycosylhydrolase, partial [Acidobacteriaceae bacterium]